MKRNKLYIITLFVAVILGCSNPASDLTDYNKNLENTTVNTEKSENNQEDKSTIDDKTDVETTPEENSEELKEDENKISEVWLLTASKEVSPIESNWIYTNWIYFNNKDDFQHEDISESREDLDSGYKITTTKSLQTKKGEEFFIKNFTETKTYNSDGEEQKDLYYSSENSNTSIYIEGMYQGYTKNDTITLEKHVENDGCIIYKLSDSHFPNIYTLYYAKNNKPTKREIYYYNELDHYWIFEEWEENPISDECFYNGVLYNADGTKRSDDKYEIDNITQNEITINELINGEVFMKWVYQKRTVNSNIK